ncbi:aldose 1-epimerase [Vibrio maritimus]|uniref:aldose 1-epimerase n=1 Tax=Vibrio maritimus TaxID=990268 RepID=UPI003736CF1C
MAPYSNRIKDDKFVFDGKSFVVDSNMIHGGARNNEFFTLQYTEQRVVLSYEHFPTKKGQYPFEYRLILVYELESDGFSVSLTLENISTHKIPIGLGFHPYLKKSLCPTGSETPLLQFSSQETYITDALIPVGYPIVTTNANDFSLGKELNFNIDNCFGKIDGDISVCWPKSKLCMKMSNCSNLDKLILFNELDSDCFAVEPSSSSVDAFNRYSQGYSDSGVAILSPFESGVINTRFTFSPM